MNETYANFLLGLMMGLLGGAGFTWLIINYVSDERQKLKTQWERAVGKTILYNVGFGKRHDRSGRPVYNWGEVRRGLVDEVKSGHRLVRINGHWYRWGEVKFIDVAKE